MKFEEPIVEFIELNYENIITGSNCGFTQTKCTDSSGDEEFCAGPDSFSHNGCEDIAPMFGN